MHKWYALLGSELSFYSVTLSYHIAKLPCTVLCCSQVEESGAGGDQKEEEEDSESDDEDDVQITIGEIKTDPVYNRQQSYPRLPVTPGGDFHYRLVYDQS